MRFSVGSSIKLLILILLRHVSRFYTWWTFLISSIPLKLLSGQSSLSGSPSSACLYSSSLVSLLPVRFSHPSLGLPLLRPPYTSHPSPFVQHAPRSFSPRDQNLEPMNVKSSHENVTTLLCWPIFLWESKMAENWDFNLCEKYSLKL